MFNFISDVVKVAGGIIGAVTGTILGLGASAIGAALDITTAMAQEAIDAGCETYEEVRKFHKL